MMNKRSSLFVQGMSDRRNVFVFIFVACLKQKSLGLGRKGVAVGVEGRHPRKPLILYNV
jgi:hypothetical protein